MGFNVQNDLGTVEEANAYVTVAAFIAYWSDRGEDYSAKTDAEIQALIIKGTEYIDLRYSYNGYRLEGRDQTTAFPRSYLYDSGGYLVAGIPREVVAACCEYAKVSITTELTVNISGTKSSVVESRSKVGPIEKAEKYASGVSSGTFAVYQTPDQLLNNSGFVASTNKTPIRG